jgi:NDP-sugar pyrophosphorylase family protein
MQLNDFTNEKIFDLNETIAAELFTQTTYAWEVLPMISDFIRRIGPTLPADRFEQRGEDIWVAKSATVFDSAYIGGPCVIDEDAEIRQCAFIRGSAIVGKGATVGNSTELKNVVLFNKVEVPHYNYVGDSVLGFHAHMGAGSITSNVKADKKNVVIHCGTERMETGRKKVGAILGDWADIGCNSVLNPGTVVGRHTNMYPLSMVRGCVPACHIYKDKDHIVAKVMD